MSIRIHNDGLAGTSASQANPTAATSIGSSESRSDQVLSGGSGDQVSISSLSERIADASRVAEAQQEARVRQLTSLYQSGQFHVDSLQLSRSLIARASEDHTLRVSQ